MITLAQYFIGREASLDVQDNARLLLDKVNTLLLAADSAGLDLPINNKTRSRISGENEGGFRLQNCCQGSVLSSHKEGKGVDVYDPDGTLDAWLDDDKLETFSLYREHPDSTRGWCHLTTRAPHSGRRTFYP